MSEQTILIVTEEYDPHADVMIRLLRQQGHQPIRLHPADFPLQAGLNIAIGLPDSGAWNGTLRASGATIDVSTVRSIWWRRPGPYRLPDGLAAYERDFAYKELDHTMRGLWDSLDCYWISHPEHIRRASYKIEQLQRAAGLGFDVPRTLITTDPAQARAFYDACHGRMVYKTLSLPMLRPDPEGPYHAIYTTPISEAHFESFETIRSAPCQFQEYVPKQLELRVTVIGDDVFAAAIHSQRDERTRDDWRHYEADIPYTKADLPHDVAERCLRLTKSYGLNYSAMDLILTPDGRYVFLENNPNGQWYFIELAVPELRMKDALAACLVRGNGMPV